MAADGAATKRLKVLGGHLDAVLTATAASGAVDTRMRQFDDDVARRVRQVLQTQELSDGEGDTLYRLLEDSFLDVREATRDFLELHQEELLEEKWSEPLDLEKRRRVCIERALTIIRSRLISVENLRDDPGRYFAVLENLFAGDMSAPSMVSIHFNLFGASVLFFGTEEHHRLLVDDINTGRALGCMMMSELGHGSDVSNVETTAVFDEATQEFVIDSPTVTSQKYWIGVALTAANWGILFARLIVHGHDHGVHPFLVKMRDEIFGPLRQGIEAKTIGAKMSLSGIDNARIIFRSHRIPRHFLLNSIGSVDAQGRYHSSFASESTRFGAIFSALVLARIGVGTGIPHCGRVALEIAIRYAHSRNQFSASKDGPELPLMVYLSHQRRLFGPLASLLAVTAFGNHVKRQLHNLSLNADKRLHLQACVLKAFGALYGVQALQAAREACGGQGYLVRNLIGRWRMDADVMLTLDGDGLVMRQQIVKILLQQFQSRIVRQPILEKAFAIARAEMHRLFGFREVQGRKLAEGDFEAIVRAFVLREDQLLYELATSLKSRSKQLKKDEGGAPASAQLPASFQAWNGSMDLVERVAEAHAERCMVESFYLMISEAKGAASRSPGAESQYGNGTLFAALSDLFLIYTLQRVHNDPWFVVSRLISRTQWAELGQEVDASCSSFAKVAFSFVRAFKTPSFVLRGTIAEDWIAANDMSLDLQ